MASSLQKKRKSRIQPIFDQGNKFVCKTFIAFFLFSDDKPLLPINSLNQSYHSQNEDEELVSQESKNKTIALKLRKDVTIIASKKVGNAIKRNRAKRRLREMIRLHIPSSRSINLIFLARSFTCEADHELLLKDCNNLIRKIKHTTPT